MGASLLAPAKSIYYACVTCAFNLLVVVSGTLQASVPYY